MEISIRKLEVYKEVEKFTSVIGASTTTEAGASLYNVVSANEYDSPVLNTFWIEATGQVATMLMRYLKSGTVEHTLYTDDIGEVFTLTLQPPARFDSKLTGTVANGIKLILANLVTAGWMGFKLPDRKKEFTDKADEVALDVKIKLLNKLPPQKSFHVKPHDNYNFTQYEKDTDHNL